MDLDFLRFYLNSLAYPLLLSLFIRWYLTFGSLLSYELTKKAMSFFDHAEEVGFALVSHCYCSSYHHYVHHDLKYYAHLLLEFVLCCLFISWNLQNFNQMDHWIGHCHHILHQLPNQAPGHRSYFYHKVNFINSFPPDHLAFTPMLHHNHFSFQSCLSNQK